MKKQGEQRLVPKLRFKGFSEDWEQRELGSLVDFYSGLTYKPENVTDERGVFVIRSSNINHGEIIKGDNIFVKSDTVNSENVCKGDIVVVVRNGSRNLIGKHAQVLEVMENTVIGAFMTGVRYEYPNFLNALLDSYRFKREIHRNLGATINQITTNNFKSMRFYFPNNDEQIKIGKIFENINVLITLHKRKIELELKYVEALKESFIPYSEQIQKSFNNIEYRVVKLEDILKERKETNVPNDEYPLVSFTADEGVTKKTERYNREFLVRKSEKKYKKTLYNDLVYNPANLKFGAINRNTFGNAVFSPIYITFTTSQDSEYLEYVFTQWNFINKALKYQEGTVYERSSVKPKDFLKIKLAIPNDINDQKFIASLIDQKLIATNKSKAFLKKLEKLKDYYLKDLFI